MRETRYLRRRYQTILSYLGLILVLCGLLMLTPLAALIVWPQEGSQAWNFIMPAVLMGGMGLAAWRWPRHRSEALSVQEGGVIVLLSWILVSLFSAWPLMASAGLNFTQAVFESVSGWTTTGLSVIDVAGASHMILLWRSIMQLAGGAGLAIIALSALTGPTGPAVSLAEGREQLVPHVRQSAKLVTLIYSGYAAIGIVALRLAGMNWFDAVNQAFPAVSTGGFSNHVESIAYWDSAAVEAVLIVLMVMGNLNFITAWLLLRGKFRAICRNGEVRLMAVLIPVSALLVFLFTARGLYPALSKSIRVAVFETISALTTTGFSTVSYGDWNSFGWGTLIVLMLVGGGACSTAGGIKQYRVYLLWKGLIWEMRRGLLPRRAVTEQPVWEAEQQVFLADGRFRQLGVFVFLYLLTYVIGAAILAAHGYGLKESLFEYASAVGTVGLSVGVTSAAAPAGVLWAETVGMLLGRLEFFVVFISAIKLIRDARGMISVED
ncbi:MAG: TrkH family potassium uptake protein [Planctomycetaceae bacterium]|nr:TrkH family potassium uptake protein [Planctomycetaceae bacterium]